MRRKKSDIIFRKIKLFGMDLTMKPGHIHEPEIKGSIEDLLKDARRLAKLGVMKDD